MPEQREHPIQIRQVTAEELPACLAVIHAGFATVAAAFHLTPENCPTNGAFLPLVRLQRDDERGDLLFGAWQGERLIGFLQLSDLGGGVWELQKLTVLPDCRHGGVGRTLVAFARDTAAGLGAATLRIGIIEENRRLRHWYEALGFVHRGVRAVPHLPFLVGTMELACAATPPAEGGAAD